MAFTVSASMLASIKAQDGSITTSEARQHWIIMGVSLLALTGLLGVQTLVLTHRVAGPARKIAEALRRLIRGEYSEFVTLRRSDYLQDLGSALNSLTRTLHDRDHAIGDAVRLVEEAIAHAPPEMTPLQTMDRLKNALALLKAARAPEPPPSSPALPAVPAPAPANP
ncbi:MAG: hypothetical protein HYY93_09520 [Planctomycetes bacterium]|nr:hypothetical protein [Planctomycetota bacterium]